MAITFPQSPSTNDTHVVGNISYVWDGAKWAGGGITPIDRLIEDSNILEIENNDLLWTGSNVGIGTTNPTQKLHVQGNGLFTSSLYVGSSSPTSRLEILNSGQDIFRPNGRILLRGGGGQSTRNSIELTNGSGVIIDGGSGETYGVELKGGGGPVKVTQGNFLVGTSTTTGTASQLLQVNSGAYVSGNVGIGTDNPAVKLDVDGSLQLRAAGNYTTYATRIYSRLDSTHCSVIESYLNSSTAFEMMGSYADGGGVNPRVVISAGGQKVGINTTNPGYNLEVNGSFAATTKSFIIDHPTKEGMKLRYGSLEGPENGVYVRGKTTEFVIELPDYWTGLVDADTISVNLTPIGKSQTLWVKSIEDNKVIVGSKCASVEYFYTIYGERKDVEKLEVEIGA